MARVVINGWDKLIAVAGTKSKQLYDLKNDPDDRKDLASENAEKVEQLWDMIDTWMKATPLMNSK